MTISGDTASTRTSSWRTKDRAAEEASGKRSRPSVAYLWLVLGLAIFLAVWWALARWVFPPSLFASPTQTAEAFRESIESGELWSNSGASLMRIGVGFGLGSALAIPLGLLMGSFKVVRMAIEPFVQFFRFIPPIALLPLAILWFGIGESSKVFLIFYSTFFIVIINVIAGVHAISTIKLRAAGCLGLKGIGLFRRVIIPSTVPYIVTGMRIAMGSSFMTIVAAEMLAADSGLGYSIFQSRLFYQTGKMFVGLIMLGVLGLLADHIFRIITRKTLVRFHAQS